MKRRNAMRNWVVVMDWGVTVSAPSAGSRSDVAVHAGAEVYVTPKGTTAAPPQLMAVNEMPDRPHPVKATITTPASMWGDAKAVLLPLK